MEDSHGIVKRIVFIDTEVGVDDKKVHDIGALDCLTDEILHTSSKSELERFIATADFLCGHNIIHHDLKFLSINVPSIKVIDTLYISPLLFPLRPYHKLLKDDKIYTEELNNPVNDCKKDRELFWDEYDAYCKLPAALQQIYGSLLSGISEFAGFFSYVEWKSTNISVSSLINEYFEGKICTNAPVVELVQQSPVELAYALALVSTEDSYSITPSWLMRNYPNVENVMRLLCGVPCQTGCPYCNQQLDIYVGLKRYFGFSAFRTFDGRPMQEQAVSAAMRGESLLTIFPTGGGKSLTFQLPAMMAGRSCHGLTVIISPLQSLMKDQVDNLAERGYTDAVTINGLLDPVSRTEAINRVFMGLATILYISPEMLRSKTIEKLLLSRNIVRFVIDEAHCFSSWGHDFRVDYLYIGDFIRRLQEQKQSMSPIPVSCFTATAKQKVITDICEYFKRKLDLDLQIYASSSNRKNLTYSVIHAESDDEKYTKLRNLIGSYHCPTIVYVSRTRKTKELSEKLTNDGFPALPFNGKMDANDKIFNQNAFITNEVQVIVATSAFGMGVDKKDVGMVVHYDISDSLENYVQEAGRAGRDPETQARCFVLYADHDLDKHFVLLNQTKLSISEIQQVWKVIKDQTRKRKELRCSALEIARNAGWDDTVSDVETRVRTAVSALEDAGYVSRGNNVPHVYATGIMVKNMDEAYLRLNRSVLFDTEERGRAIRIIRSLISSKNVQRSQNEEQAESRIDYLADILGMNKEQVISVVSKMREEGILADSMDMSATIYDGETDRQSRTILERFARLERALIELIPEEGINMTCKELNDLMDRNGVKSSVKNIRTLLYFLSIKGYVKKQEDSDTKLVKIFLTLNLAQSLKKHDRRIDLCAFIVKRLFELSVRKGKSDESLVVFSVLQLQKAYMDQSDMFAQVEPVSIAEMEDALLYLSKIGAMKLEGGFLVLYNAMEIKRLADGSNRYKKDDYRLLDEFYKQKIRQIHIVGEYANLMVRDYNAALQYVQDYFQMDFKKFIAKYFKGERAMEIEKNITPAKYEELIGGLSDIQRQIISDKESKCIVVAAGPGSGKTKVLVHKLASLLLMEDVKHEQLLMLTFSRAAATEFKKRLLALIGNAAHFVEIKTFHSYAFDLLGKMGNLDDAKDVVKRAADMIEAGEVEQGRICKAVLVVDEAQDMDEDEFALVSSLMKCNEDMRVVMVGDDDQNIFEFRGSDSRFLRSMVEDMHATRYEMTDNYRSVSEVVSLANTFVTQISERMKKAPIVSKKEEAGCVSIKKYVSRCLELPLVNSLKKTYREGRACVLTQTNEEALQVVALLTKEGVRAQLIQSMNGFSFRNLAEIRYFLKSIESQLVSPVISDQVWDRAKEKTICEYSTSSCLDIVKNFFSEFEKVSRTKYFSDLKDYLEESNIEDFYDDQMDRVYVSTIHKSKGREFDSVYMMLSGTASFSDEAYRRLYVGITRAKNNLYVLTNTDQFDRLPNLLIERDFDMYEEPNEVAFQLTHKDVYLSFFKERKREILQMRSGESLLYQGNGFFSNNRGVVIMSLSKKFLAELADWEQKGFLITASTVRFIVAWKGEDDTEETAVILADLKLKRS